MNDGKSIRLYLADGTPGGLLTAEIMNWTGHIVAAPRSELATLLKRPEASRTGIYILIGDDPANFDGTVAYIGEGDDVSKRLYQHARPEEQGGKDFWDRAIIITSKDTNLTKAHARYLESRLISLALQTNRAKLENGTAPPELPLPEADISDMKYFISQIRIVLPVLGVNLFRSAAAATISDKDSSSTVVNHVPQSPVFELTIKRSGITARAQEVDGEFTVYKGSLAHLHWTAVDHAYKRLREKLEEDGTLTPTADGELRQFTKNQVFASPSAAAAVVFGHAANGRLVWKTPDSGLTYGSWQSQGVDKAVEDVLS